MAFYRTQRNRYGLPLDNRQTFTKTDWLVWTATLADSRADFDALVAPIYDFLNATPDRVALSDFYWTQDAKDVGMHARPVIGGVFIKMLAAPALWKKWATRDKTQGGDWAALPPPPLITEVVPSSQNAPAAWRYTTETPSPDWFQPDFDASGWKEGPGGFGTQGTPGAVVRTEWKTADIWIRREFTLPAGDFPGLQLLVHHDEDAEIYLNGVLATKLAGYISDYEPIPLRLAARAALKPGKNSLAVHCHQTTGGQYIDVGLVNVEAKR